MVYEINNLLDLNYLNNLISQSENELSNLKNQLMELYDIEGLKKLSISEIKELFLRYNLNCSNLIQYLESDFINSDWEFADLFVDDIDYSNDLEEKLKDKALLELAELNARIDLNNKNLLSEIKVVEENVFSFRKILEMLDSNYFVLEEDVKWLTEFVSKQDAPLAQLYFFSSEISKRLIEKNKQILEKKAKEDELLFETSLEDIYGKTETQNVEPTYLEEINKYYNKYKNAFDSVNFGNGLEKIMELSNELIIGVEKIDSLEDFCISLGYLFYKINSIEDEIERENILNEIIELDKMYEDKNNKVSLIINNIDNFIQKMQKIPAGYFDMEFYEKIIILLKSYKTHLLENIFDDTNYEKTYNSLNDIDSTINQIICLTELNDKIKKILNLSSSSSDLSDQDYLELSGIQQDILCFIEMVMQDGYKEDIEKIYNNYLLIVENFKHVEIEDISKTQLNGFVLFDFGDDNVPYVISDLDPHSKDNLIDVSILQGKCDSGFQDYNDLITDLLLYGTPRALHGDANNYNLYKLLNPVYSNKNSRKDTTGMMRIRPYKSSLVRFISRDVVLKPGTEIYNQVTNLLCEILPGVEIDYNKEFKLVINFASSMKGSSEESYRECILRYDRHSPLYRLFFSDTSKTKLSEMEYNLLRDIIHMSLDAYFKLENVNAKLSFDIIRSIGGRNAYGK